MNNETWQNGRKSRNKGGKLVPALCNIAGTLILVAVIVFCLPVTLAKLCGYEVYNVVSGSMEPEIPVGSAIYVEAVPPEEVQEGDVIAFWSNDAVIAHRVPRNKLVEGTFTTKGDANAEEDMNDIEYAALIGRVAAHYPMLGQMMVLYTSSVGKVYVVCFAACGCMFHILAGRLRERRKRRQAEA